MGRDSIMRNLALLILVFRKSRRSPNPLRCDVAT
jgi:hypothetical protein